MTVQAEPTFHRLYPSIVKSVRQSRLLDAWMRRVAGGLQLPALDDFAALKDYPEQGELMTYDVIMQDGAPKYRVSSEGAALVASFGFSGKGRFLDEIIDPALWIHTAPIYRTCVEERLPVYSIFSVLDRDGQKVIYERLLLPFGTDIGVAQMVAVLKTTAWTGEFENKDLMRPEGHQPEYVLRAVITRPD